MVSHLRWALLACLAVISVTAQPVVAPGGVLNAASYSLPGLPNSAIAQGSMFVVFGEKLGQTSDLNALRFPLPTSAGLLGTSIKVTVGSTSVDAIMIYTTPTQVAAVLPSSTPVGAGKLVLTANGQASAPVDITVGASAFGTFTRNKAGSGPPIVQLFVSETNQPLLDVRRPAQPGQTMILWGTGLGPVKGDEAAGPLPGNLQEALNVEVFVGSKKANVTYAGRSGCCVGIDQVVFTVPDGVEGCYVPVVVRANGVVSNFPTMAISRAPICGDANSISGLDLAPLAATGNIRLGVLDLSRIQIKVSAGPLVVDVKSDSGNGVFGRYTSDQVADTRGVSQTASVGSCGVSVFRGLNPNPVDPIRPAGADAGAAISVVGPKGTKPMPRVLPGTYLATLGGAPLDQILTGIAQPDYLDLGEYTITGSGGAGDGAVGAFSVKTTIPAQATWTNSDATTAIDRTKDLEITWTGGDPNSFVLISAIGTASGATGPTATTPGSAFLCVERASAGKFTVPSFVLQALPATTPGGLLPSAFMLVGGMGTPVKFTAPNIDLGILNYRLLSGKNIQIR